LGFKRHSVTRSKSVIVLRAKAHGYSHHNVRLLTDTKAVCYMPSWARTENGERIVFGSHGARPEMASIRPDGTGLTMLGEGHDPCLSPDGKLIAYTGHLPGGVTVFLMDADGGNKRALVNEPNPFGAVFPNWSPDGKKIVFSKNAGESLELFLVNVDGSGLSRLTALNKIATPRGVVNGWQVDFLSLDRRTVLEQPGEGPPSLCGKTGR
jgi:TolB protein